MKRAWLYILLGVSIGLNVGVVGSFVYRRQSRLRRDREMVTHFDGGMKHHVTDLMREYQSRMESTRVEFKAARDSLLELGLQDEADPAEVDIQLDRMANTYREMTRMVYEIGRTIQEMHPQDKRKWLRRRMRRMMRDPHRQRGRGWRGRGPRHRNEHAVPSGTGAVGTCGCPYCTPPPPPSPGQGD